MQPLLCGELCKCQAVDMGLKILDVYPVARNFNVDVKIECPVDFSRYRLLRPIDITPNEEIATK